MGKGEITTEYTNQKCKDIYEVTEHWLLNFIVKKAKYSQYILGDLILIE